jgi:uncharacterized repeat protein (TIGR01451 family)
MGAQRMNGRKHYDLAIVFGLLLILSAGLVGLVQATPVQASSAASALEASGTSGGGERISVAPADLTARPGQVIPPSMPPGGPLLDTAVLTLTKRANPDPVNAGDVLTYTVTVYNGGGADAIGTIITDGLDTRVDFASASDGETPNSGVVTWNVGVITAGHTITRSLWVTVSQVTSGTTLSNTAGVTSTGGIRANDAITTLVHTAADLHVSKRGSSDPVIAGTALSYTIAVTNHGPSNASGVSLIDTLPTGLIFNGSRSSSDCLPAGQQITCSVDTLPAKGVITRTITVTAAAWLANETVLTNAVQVFGSEPDPTPDNNLAKEATTFIREADLQLTKQDWYDPVGPSQPVVYTLAVTNNGPSDAAGVVLTDTLPAGVGFPEIDPGAPVCTHIGSIVTCNWDSIASGASKSVDINADPLQPGVVVNRAEVSSNEPDSNPTNNAASQDTTLIPANLSITKQDAPDPALVGKPVTYTLTVFNIPGANTNPATNVTLTDTLPIGVDFASASPGCSQSDGIVVCTHGTLFQNTSVVYSIVVTPTTNGLLTNVARVAADQPDPDTSNNTFTATTTVNASTDLQISKTGPAGSVVIGTSFNYVFTVKNNGPSNATGVTIHDTLPEGLRFSSGSQCSAQAQGRQVTCNVGSLLKDELASRTITVNADASLADGALLTNTATVSGNETDLVESNDSSSTQTGFVRQADLGITKTDSDDPVVAGTSFSYNLSVTNNGPSDASGVVISDTLPAGLSFNTSDPIAACSAVGQEVTCDIGNLAAHDTVDLTLFVMASASLLDGIQLSNTASVSGEETDLPTGNNSDTKDTTVRRQADLGVSLSDSTDPVGIGGSFTYYVTVTNHGPSDASGVKVSDTLPAGLSFNTSGSSSECSPTSQQVVTCDINDLAAGLDVVLAVAVDVDDSLADGTLLSNTVVVSVNEADPNGSNDSATEDTLGKVLKVYLPVLIRSQTELSVFNDNTGGYVTFTVVEAGVSCVVPNNTTQFCGSFEPGTYTIRVSSLCGEAETVKTYGNGPVTTRVYCK